MTSKHMSNRFPSVTLDAPALIRFFEYIREDLSKVEGDEGDIMLHFLADELLNSPSVISMAQYNQIIRDSRHNYLRSQGALSDLFYPLEGYPSEESVVEEMKSTASLEYPYRTALTKLTNYGAALMINGVPPFEEFKKELKKRPYIWNQVLPEVMEKTGWDEERVLQTAFDRAQKSIATYQERYIQLPGVVDRAVEIYHNGDEGKGWYEKAHEALVATFGEEADLMAAFIASTSPGNNPSVNLQKALQAYQQYKEGIPFSGVGTYFGDQVVVKNLERAVRGEPLHGLKVWNFCRALQGDQNAVVVDMWMARAFLGKDGKLTDGEYLFVEQLIREVAHALQKPSGSVTMEDVRRASQKGLFQNYPDIQAQIWYGINPKPKSYPESLHHRLKEREEQSPDFWAPYLDQAQSYQKVSAMDPQLYVVEATKDSGVPYPITQPMPQVEAMNMLMKKQDQWEKEGYSNLTVKPAKDPIQARKGGRLSDVEIDTETWDEAKKHHHYNPGLVLVYKGHRYPIDSGQRDRIDVFEEEGLLYILSSNRRVGYVGLQVLDPKDGKEVAQIFLQNSQDLEEILGEDWNDLGPEEILKLLLPYIG
jgi:hypothetical protein